ncbi:MAG TPA: FAD-dependent oxidoreductase [Bacteroidales bacterium]|nr:FAD-dependent oxidoreductase [Bacteroidales bacterium]
MNPATLGQLLGIILNDLNTNNEVFDIPGKLFYKHWHNHVLYSKKYGQELHNPIGLTSGPHTQLAQNIVSGWLCGARYIELKTVTPAPATGIIKPSISIYEGAHHCETTIELDVEQAYDQFLNAWIIIHILNHKLFTRKKHVNAIGTIFNMSLGNTLADIRSEKMQWFVDKMIDCSVEKTEKLQSIKSIYPDIDQISIPDQISNSFTVNTSKDCSAREIEYICKLLMVDKKLHPVIKFSPTLLGYRSVRAIVSAEDALYVEIDEEHFEEDVQYGEAIDLIDAIKATAAEMKLELTIKICGGLLCRNVTTQIPEAASDVYLTGNALHPVAVNLAAKFQSRFEGSLNISFSGGADCYNVSQLLLNGFSTITVCTDLLKPGGYGRLAQYFQELSRTFANYQAKNIREYILKSGSAYSVQETALENLRNYAIRTLNNPAYKKTELTHLSIKNQRPLFLYDCVHAPCVDACDTHPNIPGYCWFAANNDPEKAIKTLLTDNPLPSLTGMLASDPCRLKCTRINYDYPVLMKEIERFIAENTSGEALGAMPAPSNGIKVAVIGGGVAGLSAAWFLTKYGFSVEIYEAAAEAGGMARNVAPDFRLDQAAVEKDIERIKAAGVKILNSARVDSERFERILESSQYIFIATGASKPLMMGIQGEDSEGVVDGISFLQQIRANTLQLTGNHYAVVGSDDLAADAARAAQRLIDDKGSVTLISPVPAEEMHIDQSIKDALADENIEVIDATDTVRVIARAGQVSGLELAEIYEDDYAQSYILEFDTVITCLGTEADIDFFDIYKLNPRKGSNATRMKRVFAGGSLLDPSATTLQVIGDARRAAYEIVMDSGVVLPANLFRQTKDVDINKLKVQKSQRENPYYAEIVPVAERRGFELITKTLKPPRAVKEAARCLQCDTICNVCVAVCPNRAMLGFEVADDDRLIPAVTFAGEKFKVAYHHKIPIRQRFQVLNIADWCNECGNCTTFCPTAGEPYRDKYRLYFNHQKFNTDNNPEALLLTGSGNYRVLTLKKDGNLTTLTENWDALIFEDDNCMAVLDKVNFKIQHIDMFIDVEGIYEIPAIAEMKILFKAVKDLAATA